MDETHVENTGKTPGEAKAIPSRLLYAILGVFLFWNACFAYICAVHLPRFFFADFAWRWKECAYTLQGIDPIHVARGIVPVDPAIGALGAGAGTVPWAYVLGNVFDPGFFSFSMAKYYAMSTFAVAIAVTGCSIYRYMKGECKSGKIALLGSFLLVMGTHWPYSFTLGNYGAICGCLIILMVIHMDDKPYLAGVLLALASVKPQLAALFYIVLLFQQRWKVFITASSIVLVAWFIASAMLSASPLDLLREMGDQGANYGGSKKLGVSFYGLCTIFIDYGVLNSAQALMISGGLGVLTVIAGCLVLLKNEKLRNNKMLFYSLPAIVSSFWFYRNHHDDLILLIPCLAFLIAWARAGVKAMKWNLSLLFVLSVYMINPSAYYSFVGRAANLFCSLTNDSLASIIARDFIMYFSYYSLWLVAAALLIWAYVKKPGQCPVLGEK